MSLSCGCIGPVCTHQNSPVKPLIGKARAMAEIMKEIEALRFSIGLDTVKALRNSLQVSSWYASRATAFLQALDALIIRHNGVWEIRVNASKMKPFSPWIITIKVKGVNL